MNFDYDDTEIAEYIALIISDNIAFDMQKKGVLTAKEAGHFRHMLDTLIRGYLSNVRYEPKPKPQDENQ